MIERPGKARYHSNARNYLMKMIEWTILEQLVVVLLHAHYLCINRELNNYNYCEVKCKMCVLQ